MEERFGIDPGITGAVAFIGSSGVTLLDTPSFKSPKGRPEYDLLGMLNILRDLRASYPDIRGVLEKVGAFPKNGSVGNFKLGRGSGLWEMALAALEIPHILVHPVRWKKTVLDGAPKTSQGEAAVAARLYPGASSQLHGPKGGLKEGRVDALLLAHYGVIAGV
jgi:hypothetical protein